MRKCKSILVRILILSVVWSSLAGPANAALVTTAEVAKPTAASAQAERDRLQAWIARKDVMRQLENYGVSPAEAQARVAALTDDEAHALAGKIDTLPAGGEVLGVLFAVFVILLVTDILGFTKVFPFTRSIK